MKLHENKKERIKLQRCLSVMLAVCMVFSGSSSYIASAEGTGTRQETAGEQHVHDESCYEKRLVCGVEENADNTQMQQNPESFAEEEGALVCGMEEHEGHVHADGCYAKGGELVCGMEEHEGHAHMDSCYTEGGELNCSMEEKEGHAHTDSCYAKGGELICGMEEHEGHIHTDNCYEAGEEQAPDTDSHEHTEACYEQVLICGKTENGTESLPAEEENGIESIPDNSISGEGGELTILPAPNQSAEPASDNGTAEAVEELLAAIPGQEEMADLLAGYKEDPGAWYQCLGQLGGQMREACSAWMALDEAQRSQVEGMGELFSLMITRKEMEDSFLERPTYCGKDSHLHVKLKGCYDENGNLICGNESHAHLEDTNCYDEEGRLECGIEEHIHTDECFMIPDVSEEDQKAIQKAGVLIAALSTPEELVAELDGYGEDLEGYTESLNLTQEQVKTARKAFDALKPEQQGYVANLEKLQNLEAVLEERTGESGEENEAEPTSCGKTAHIHRDDCFDGSGEIVCGMEEHSHSAECFLTEEEKKQIEKVNQLIAALPSQEEILERIAELEAQEGMGAAEEDLAEGNQADGAEKEEEDAYAAYMIALMEQIAEARDAYEALGEKLQQYVEGAEYLLTLSGILSGVTLDENVWGVMGPDEAYVNEIKITSIKTGAAPFDTEEGQGNDTTAEDKIVRTFDTVTYNFSVNMVSWDSSRSYSEARVKLEFVLPLTEKEAVFDQTAMAWMDQTEGYKPQLTTETRTIDDVERSCQVLTCYKRLLPSSGNQSVVPGDFGENVTINVRAMKNRETFAPMFSAAMEGGTWKGACTNEEHKINGEPAVEKKTITAERVEVTAAPRYNIQLDGNGSYKDDFNFQGDEDWMKQFGKMAANTDITAAVPGRIMKLGITLQLYNDNQSKGLKGIELPTGDITFDLEVSSEYTINTPAVGYNQGQKIDTSEDYRPLLWSYGHNDWKVFGGQNTDGRVLYDQLACSPHAPYSMGGDKNSCYQSGTWSATQDRDTGTIHVTVSGYEIDPDRMPVINGDSAAGSYGANVGCFSSGGIWIVQPYNTITDGTHGQEPNFDVVNTYGQGSFATRVRDVRLRATTLSGAVVEEGKNGFAQMVARDDDMTRTLELTLPGALQNRVRYCSATDPGGRGSGVDDSRDGRDYAAVGSELYLMGGFSYNAQREESNRLYLGTNLTKFYGSAIELQEDDWFPGFTNGAELGGKTGDHVRENIRIRYATKKDGKDWKDDNELLHTYEEDLIFYYSLGAIPKGHICVGILFTFIGPGAPADANDPYYNCFYKARVRDDMNLAGKTFMLASTSRVWTKGMYETDNHDPNNIPDWTEEGTNLWSFPAYNWHYRSANIDGSTWYTKETYKEDGSGIYGTHNSDWAHWGDTLLVIGYKTKISKYLMQKDNNGQDKKTFNLDADQRVVDFKLEPGTYYDQRGQFNNTTTVTIVDTLPKYLTYKPRSAYFGGAYEQSSENGGTQGRIVSDTSADAKFPNPVLKEPDVKTNPDGTQTLTWVLSNVGIGDSMAPVYYSADIGTKGDPEADVPVGTTNLENLVHISAPGDLRDPLTTGEKHSKVGIAVTRGSASSFGKYARQKVADEDGQIDYVVYYNNNAETGTSLTIMDTMPMNEVNGSRFTGSYTFAQWKLDVKKCNVDKINIYYTFDEKYKDKTTKEVKKEEIETWKKASIGADGTIAIPTEVEGMTEEQSYPVAWAVVGTLDSGQSVSIDLKIQLKPGASDINKKETNYFVNRLSSGDTTTTTETPTVRRTLEGLTWMDYNRDGLQDAPETEIRISGVKVELLKLREGENPENENSYENVFYPKTDQNAQNIPVVIETGKQISVRAENGNGAVDYEPGRYRFTDLPAGTYAVRFTDGNGETKITKLNATSVNCGGDDTRDSDAVASRDENGKLIKTAILNLEMPKAENMAVSLYESKYHDSGFYPDTQMTLQKVGEGGEPLTGAIFTIQDGTGATLSFTYGTEGYTPYDEAGEEFRKDKYYIALAANPYYVIGVNGTGNGSPVILQNRTGNANQLFEIRREEDFYSFLNVASGKWLDLDSGNLGNGAKIHVWENSQPNNNQKWYVTAWDAGSRISAYGDRHGEKDQWCLDLNGGTAQENQKIHLYSRNETSAQKWVLIPAGITADTQTDLNVDSAEGLTINNLKPGDYTITEIKSPTGHSLLSRPVNFTVKGDGSIETADGMAMVDGEGNTVLKIKNTRLYSLPSTGGSGTGIYVAAGMLLMISSLLYAVYSRRRKAA